jgi:hypothetical protein
MGFSYNIRRKQEGIKLGGIICPTVTKIICKPRKNGQDRLVFGNSYHLSEGIRIFLIASDKCSVDISDVEEYFSILIHKKPHLSDTIRKNWIPSDK